MFSGIVERTAKVISWRGKALTIDGEERGGQRLRPGGSLAINGVCLTVTAHHGSQVTCEVIEETRRRTTLGELRPGDRINIEYPLRAGDPIDGHIMLGHVDGVGTIQRIQITDQEAWMDVGIPHDLRPYLIPKGSIAIDGVSLTIGQEFAGGLCRLYLISETRRRTTLGAKTAGQRVNVEADYLGKFVLRTLGRLPTPGPAPTRPQAKAGPVPTPRQGAALPAGAGPGDVAPQLAGPVGAGRGRRRRRRGRRRHHPARAASPS